MRVDEQPCRIDCPDRTAECKVKCEKWAAFTAKKQEEYKRRREMYDELYDIRASESRRYGRSRRHGQY